MRKSHETLPRVSIDSVGTRSCAVLTRCRAPDGKFTTDGAGTPRRPSDIGQKQDKECDESTQNDTASTEPETRDCAPMPNKSSSNSSQHGSVTPDASAGPVTQSTRQSTNVLQHRMDRILRDWEECQEADDSDSDSDTSLDTSAGNRFVSMMSASQIRCSGGTSFTRHGDAPPSGAPGDAMTSGPGSGNGNHITQNNLTENRNLASQGVRDGSSEDISEVLTDDSHTTTKKKTSDKMLPCPIQGCRGKDSSISELL
jgi:hypothetical protein